MKFIFTGPECSGKTTLASLISKKYGMGLVREMARTYLSVRKNRYNEESLKDIAILQQQEELIVQSAFSHLCCDTDLLTILVWNQEKYRYIPCEMAKTWNEQTEKLFFLCAPDIPWEFDVQRENQFDRDRLFSIYEKMLIENQCNYHVISGELSARIVLVEQIINNTLKNIDFLHI